MLKRLRSWGTEVGSGAAAVAFDVADPVLCIQIEALRHWLQSKGNVAGFIFADVLARPLYQREVEGQINSRKWAFRFVQVEEPIRALRSGGLLFVNGSSQLLRLRLCFGPPVSARPGYLLCPPVSARPGYLLCPPVSALRLNSGFTTRPGYLLCQ